MRTLLFLAIGSLLIACAMPEKTVPGTDIPQKVFELNTIERTVPILGESEMRQAIGSLNRYLGSYPPRFRDAEQREEIYKKWVEIQSDVVAYHRNAGDTQQALLYMAEIHRQGHNMDVRGAAEKADAALTSCTQKYDRFAACHHSATYFYLSIGPKYLHKAKHSLDKLRTIYAPQRNQEVESGYVFYYIYKQDKAKALAQIEFYLTEFPDGARVKDFTVFQRELQKTQSIQARQQ